MNDEKNLAIICDIRNNSPVGVICVCPITGDVAFVTENEILEKVLDTLLDNKVFLYNNEEINNHKTIITESIKPNDYYYIMAINYSLPFPWRMLGVTSTKGEIEEIVRESSEILKKGGVNLEKIN